MKFRDGESAFDVEVNRLVVAGWTGRDAAAVAHHIAELEEIGVAPPSGTPLFYRVSSTLLVQAAEIQVLGPATSGEAEPLLIRSDGGLWLGLASDHTDREMEAVSVAGSKQACPKVCAAGIWPFAEVAGHLDALRLRSWIFDGAAWTPYQDGALSAILPLQHLLDRFPLEPGAAMLCGTLPAIGGIRSAGAFRAELEDPELGRTIRLEYRTAALPVIS